MRIMIGTLSKAFDLSDEALRFYEKKGLVRPKREGETGYRVYERVDIQRIGNIKRMKNQGFTLEEINSVYTGMSEAQLRALYHRKAAEMCRNIVYSQHVFEHMQEALNVLQCASELINVPQSVSYDTVYALEYSSIEEMWERLPCDPQRKDLLRQIPLVSYTTFINKEALFGAPPVVRKGLFISDRDADVLGIDRSLFRCIDAHRAVSCLFRLENGAFPIESLLKRLSAFCQERSLTPADDIFTVQLVNFIDPDSRAVHYARMVVPLAQHAV